MEEQQSTNKSSIKSPSVSLPKGGGAIKSLGETFQPNAFSGTGSYSIAIPVTPARGIEPHLSIDYNSGSGNSEFGIGFSLSLPKISIRTEKGIPRYDGNDIYTAGSGELVPKMKGIYKDKEGWDVYEYLPRIEAAFSIIERHVKEDKSESYWKIVSSNNETSYFGLTNESRVYNPDDTSQIFEWLIDNSIDAKGNRIIYVYKAEDNVGTQDKIWEQGRSFNNKYIQNIKYGNYIDANNQERFAFEVVFDYGEYDILGLNKGGKNPYVQVGDWIYRHDAFSSYTSGFEIRTCRLCHNILLFHCFEKELGDPCLVKSVGLKYEQSLNYGKIEISGPSAIQSVILTGYRREGEKAIDPYELQRMPAVKFVFSKFNPPQTPEFKELLVNKNSIPGYLNKDGFQPVDLNNEGISGLLYHAGNSILYCEPEGDGKYATPTAPEKFPIDRNFRDGNISLVDLESRGELELVVKDSERAGFYQKDPDSLWSNYQPFESYPTDYSNPDLEMVGLSNNGKTDLLLSEEDNILVYPSIGKKGYSAAERNIKPSGFPTIKKDYKKEQVGFANLFGDGLSHRLKISNGCVECWPDLGYGRFGGKITLGNAPQFGQDFDVSRLFLADIDGSGTIDLIYAYSDRIELFINSSGNFFSNAITVFLPEQYTSIDQIDFSDVLGNGTTCLVFTKVAPAVKHYYYDFVGEIIIDGLKLKSMKPYLLNDIDNNLGSVSQIQYCSSTKFYLEDKKAGAPWVTKLPFPVQLVEKTIVFDKITGSRYTHSFKYHDGYYDSVEREFRGFGFVEAWDTEEYEDFVKNINNQEVNVRGLEKENYVPPVYTKTWYHTGVCIDSSKISTQYKEQYFNGDKNAYDFPDSVFASEIYCEDAETIRQAYVAMSGQVIRKEVYSDDKDTHPEIYKNPYTVEESNVEVKLFQKREKGGYAVFMVNARESISYQYERNPDDPRIQQGFSLVADGFGNILQSCSVFLPRRSGVDNDAIIYPEQQQLKATVSLNVYVRPLPEYLYCHTACEKQELELFNLDLKNSAYFNFDEIKSQASSALQNIVPYEGVLTLGVLQARQFTWNRSYFWNEPQTDFLPHCEISIRALMHHNENAVFTKDFVVQVFDGRLTDETLQSKGGYFFDQNSKYWWNKGLVQHYFLPITPTCFYMPCKTENTFVDKSSSLFSQTIIEYDRCYFSPIQIAQYIDDNKQNIVKAEIDYITYQPKQIVDINSNTAQALFDPLGQVVVTSLFGTENGVNTGGMTLYSNGQIAAEYKTPENGSFDDVINNPDKYLQGASTYFYYNLNAWIEKQQPTCSINLIRNNYWHSSDKDKLPYCQMLISYSDGIGRELEKKIKTDSGIAFIREVNGELILGKDSNPAQDETDNRWQVSGRTVYNNKGKPFEQYLPYFINTPEYEDQKDIPCPPPTVTHYDPLEREIRIDSPKGFFSKIEFTPWREVHFDEDDTVLDSQYYKLNYPDNLSLDQKDAIDKAVKFYNTPTTKVIDNTGDVFLDIQNNFGNVSKNAFVEIVQRTTFTSEEVWDELKAKGYILEDKSNPQFTWLTHKFQPYTKGFELYLDVKFKSLIGQITTLLRQNELTSYYTTDVSGRNTETIDPRLYYSNQSKDTNYYNFRYRYAMGAESPILIDSIDAGTEKHLSNIFDGQLWSWSARSYCQIISYDRLQRRTELRVKKIIDSGSIYSYDDFNLVEIFTYGEIQPNAQERNLNGQLYELKDLSGIALTSQYSIQGDVLEASRQMVKEYKTAANWNAPIALQDEIFPTKFSYGAVKQLVIQVTPDGSVTTNSYNQAGQLITVNVEFSDKTNQQVITHIEYDAKGQRTIIKYGNNINTTYSYEETTLRLDAIKSTRPINAEENPEIQNIEYYYDPVGNITRTRDNTINVVFSKNQKVEPLSSYTYDALYRLIQANGRQHQGISTNTYKNNPSDGSFKQSIYGPPPSTNDADKLENYSESYTYDDSGNLIKKQHIATSASWTKETAVEDNSNRLKGLDYDASGNLRKLDINNSVDLSFNCCENLIKAGIIERPDELDDSDYYLYNSHEQRTRKVSERMANGGDVTLVEDKIYLGNYEIKRNYSGSVEQPSGLSFERQTLRVMDDKTCVAIIYYITTDKKNPEKEKIRQCRFQMSNNLGSVSLEMDKTAKLITYEEYFPYGGTAIITGENQAEVALKEYRYSGKECDDSTGLYYYGARYYASWLGRWLKPDPAGTVDGMNLYAFVGGNPITFNDQNGMSKDKKVTPQKRELLTNAHDAIQDARQNVPYAGNVWDDVNSTHAESTARLSVARSILQTTFGDIESRGLNNAINRAASAITAHGGACNEFSALTHTYLISHPTTQPIFRVWDEAAHHSFTMIGDPRMLSEHDIIVADAWPSHYQAATLADTRWNSELGPGRLSISTETPIVSVLQAAQNALDLQTAIGLVPAVGQPNGGLPQFPLLYGAFGSTSGMDDPRGPRNIVGGETHDQYYQRTLTWSGLFGNDYSTVTSSSYRYYEEAVNVTSRGLLWNSTNVVRTFNTGPVVNFPSWSFFN
ncbi:MAG: sugar-binding protein [Bacteroidales bacterium]|nr:MAG: sugar-binding protein [Bacteroidales bacterium]